jgi:hypothetical protein
VYASAEALAATPESDPCGRVCEWRPRARHYLALLRLPGPAQESPLRPQPARLLPRISTRHLWPNLRVREHVAGYSSLPYSRVSTNAGALRPNAQDAPFAPSCAGVGGESTIIGQTPIRTSTESSEYIFGSLLQRTIYHYWYHTGENTAIRQNLRPHRPPGLCRGYRYGGALPG